MTFCSAEACENSYLIRWLETAPNHAQRGAAYIRDIVRKGADFVVDIPMRGKVGSLNVSVAAAVALFEIARRRCAAKQPG